MPIPESNRSFAAARVNKKLLQGCRYPLSQELAVQNLASRDRFDPLGKEELFNVPRSHGKRNTSKQALGGKATVSITHCQVGNLKQGGKFDRGQCYPQTRRGTTSC